MPLAVGRYRIKRTVGSGAFGAVYLAYDPQLDRDVALKVPHPGVLESPTAVDRFLREARAAGRLRHGSIVPVYDAGQDDEGRYYIASAFVPGLTLADVIAEGPLPARRAAELVATLAEALEHAHESGVVHRDVKPTNVLLDAAGTAADRRLRPGPAPGAERLDDHRGRHRDGDARLHGPRGRRRHQGRRAAGERPVRPRRRPLRAPLRPSAVPGPLARRHLPEARGGRPAPPTAPGRPRPRAGVDLPPGPRPQARPTASPPAARWPPSSAAGSSRGSAGPIPTPRPAPDPPRPVAPDPEPAPLPSTLEDQLGSGSFDPRPRKRPGLRIPTFLRTVLVTMTIWGLIIGAVIFLIRWLLAGA